MVELAVDSAKLVFSGLANFFKCSDQDRFEVRVTPKYFTDGQGWIR